MRFNTNFKISRFTAATLNLVVFFLAGCKDPIETTLPESASKGTSKTYLTFNNFEEFRRTYEEIGNQSPQEQRAWDNAQNFTSLGQLYQDVISEEAFNYEQEELLYKVNPNTEPKHQSSVTLTKVSGMVTRDSVNGGVVLNLFHPKMAAVLNKDGIVRINGSLYKFTYEAIKSIPVAQVANLETTVALLNKTDKNDNVNRIYVSEVKHNQREVPIANARRDFRDSFSCEGLNGSPANLRIICYLDEYEYTVVQNNNPWGITETIKGGAITATVRTLKRGTFGSWYDKSSQEQRFGSANFSFRAGSVLGSPERAYSDLPGGKDYCYQLAANGWSANFTLTPPSQTSSYNVTVFGNEYSDFAGPSGTPPSNLRSATGVIYNATWNAYGCACNITRSY